MSNEGEIIRRLEKLEDADEKMKDALQQLIISNTSMSQTLTRLAELAPVVHKLELDNVNNKLAVNAVKWLAMTIGGSAIVMVMAFLFKGGM